MQVEGKDLKGLTPFSDEKLGEGNTSTVGEIPFQVVKVFNEEYC